MIDIPSVTKWLGGQGPRALCYHVGLLAPDRLSLYFKDGKWNHEIREPLNTVAKILMDACDLGRVILFQKRLGPGEFAYHAIRLRRMKV